MKRSITALTVGCVILLIGGCFLPQVTELAEDSVRVISEAGFIYRPLINYVDDWFVQPGAKEVLSFASGRDQYGNKVGLKDDGRWTIEELIFKCELKTENDTVFTPANLVANAFVVFPLWTAPMETISGLPYPPSPLEGYPWDSCLTLGIPEMPGQNATITASARAEWIEIEIALPERSDGFYTLDLPGYTPGSSNVLTVRLSGPQEVTATWADGDREEAWTFDVLVDWFWVNGEWTIPVGASSVY